MPLYWALELLGKNGTDSETITLNMVRAIGGLPGHGWRSPEHSPLSPPDYRQGMLLTLSVLFLTISFFQLAVGLKMYIYVLFKVKFLELIYKTEIES